MVQPVFSPGPAESGSFLLRLPYCLSVFSQLLVHAQGSRVHQVDALQETRC